MVRPGAPLSLRGVLVVVLVLARLAGAAEETPVDAPTAEALVDEPKPRPLYWDEGIRYYLEVPLEVVPEEGVLGEPLERRLAVVGKIVARLQVDAAGYVARSGLDSIDPGAEVRRFIFGTRGQLFLVKSVRYAIEVELTGNDIEVGDNYLWWDDLPFVRTFKVGNYSPPMSLEAITSSRDITFMERALAVDALIPGRKFGIQIGGPELQQRLTWYLGLFTSLQQDTDTGDQSKRGGRLVGRVTWLPEDDPDAERLTHLGLSANFTFKAENIRYRTRPESHLAPYLLVTGDLAAEHAPIWGLEFATIRGPWLVQAEHIGSAVEVEETSFFHGSYVAASRFVTGETPTYDRSVGCLDRIVPLRPFSIRERRFGAWRVGGRLSWLDLSDGDVRGGRELNLIGDVTWYLNRYVLMKVEYGFGAIGDRPDDGRLHFVQARLQVDIF